MAHVLVDDSGPVRILTLNRPDRRNALSLTLMEELLGCVRSSTAARAIVIAAAGPVFCSGHDLGEMVGRSEADYRAIFQTCSDLMLALQDAPQPVIAEVQGMATAAGCQLVAACDLAVAADTAKFATPGVKIGLFCSTPAVPLVRAIGRKRAMQMLLTGDPIDAPTAVDWGLINSCVPAAGLRQTTLALATRIAQASASTIALGKQAFYEQVDAGERSAYDQAKAVMTRNSLEPDAQEGISAFLEKRAPVYGTRR
jgi:enoyl-CoA hydratase/carnithine racemase